MENYGSEWKSIPPMMLFSIVVILLSAVYKMQMQIENIDYAPLHS